MKRLIPVLLLSALVLALAAPPIFPADKETIKALALLQQSVDRLTADMRDMRSAMDERMGMLRSMTEQQTATVARLNAAIDQVQQSVQASVARQSTKVDAIAGNVQAVNDSLEDIRGRVAKLSEQMAAMRVALETLQTAPAPAPAQPQPTPVQPPPPDPGTLYKNALRDFQGSNYDLAIRGFQDYLKYYSQTDLAGNAQYWIGECLYQQGKFADAIDAYNLVLDRYPDGNKTATAHLKKGMSLLELKDRKGALAEFNTLIRRFPNTNEAKNARERVKELNKTGAVKAPAAAKAAKKNARR